MALENLDMSNTHDQHDASRIQGQIKSLDLLLKSPIDILVDIKQDPAVALVDGNEIVVTY